jgi:hypothetical protein
VKTVPAIDNDNINSGGDNGKYGKMLSQMRLKIKCAVMTFMGRSQWLRGLRRRSAVAGVAGLNSAGVMDVCLLCLYVVLSCVGIGLCDGLITRPEESYRVSVCV